MTEDDANSHIVNSNENTERDLSIVAKNLYDNQDYEQALKLYGDILLYSSDSDLYVKMGNCFNKLNKSQTALEYWQKAIDIDSMNSDAFINIGNYYYKNNDINRAISYWQAALVAMPEEPTSSLNLAVAYTFKEMPIYAYMSYERYLKYAQDKTSKKYKEINDKIEHNRKLANDYLKLGVQYQNSQDNISALNCYSRAIQYYPLYSKVHLNLGSIYYIDKNYAEAVKHWENASFLDPCYPKIISNLAISYDMLSKFDYAYCYYSKYLNYIGNDKAEYEKISARCAKLKPYLKANPFLISKHLDIAKEAFANCNYFKAIYEFKNYIILKPEEQTAYGELIFKIENYLHPEIKIMSMCNDKGKEFMVQEKYKEAQQYYARILVLSEQGSVEYTNAKRKFGICLQHS